MFNKQSKVIRLENNIKVRTFSSWDIKEQAKTFKTLEEVELKRKALSNIQK